LCWIVIQGDAMDPELDQRLSRIATHWSTVYRAHHAAADAATAAQWSLLERYRSAVFRYLLGAVHEVDAAEDLAQEFALRFLRGDFHRADPERGRFRDFLKTALFHLAVDFHKKRKRAHAHLRGVEHLEDFSAESEDRKFLTGWQDEMLARAWAALAEIERRSGQPFHTVLRFRADHPDLRSPQLAAQLGRSLTATHVRQLLHRAREKFADLLVEEVKLSLTDPTPEQLEQEVIDLGLLEYCGSALKRRDR